MARGRVSLGRSFNGLWFATGSANLADGMAVFIFPLMALAVGASPAGVAAVSAVLWLAWPVFGLHAGWIVDRVDRRTLMASANLVRAGTLVGVTAAHLTGTLSLSVILVAVAVIGVAETLVDTGLTSTVPLVIEPAGRSRANARIEGTISVSNELVGPPLAGLLAGVTFALTTGVSAGLYALTVVGIAVMALRRAKPATPSVGPVKITDGMRFLWRQPVVRGVTLFTAALNVVWAAATALLVIYAVAPGPLKLNAAEYGLMVSGMAAGGLVAAMLVERLRRLIGVAWSMIIDHVGILLVAAAVALGAGAWAVALAMFMAGAGVGIWRILAATIRQNLTRVDLLGRVYAASRVISWGVAPVSAGLAGVAAELWGVRAVFVIGTVLSGLTLATFIPFALRHDLSAIVASDPPADAGMHHQA